MSKRRYGAIEEGNRSFPSAVGEIDNDPDLGPVEVMREGFIHEEGGTGGWYWKLGRRQSDGTIVLYIPALADVRRKELTEEQAASANTVERAIRKLANMEVY